MDVAVAMREEGEEEAEAEAEELWRRLRRGGRERMADNPAKTCGMAAGAFVSLQSVRTAGSVHRGTAPSCCVERTARAAVAGPPPRLRLWDVVGVLLVLSKGCCFRGVVVGVLVGVLFLPWVLAAVLSAVMVVLGRDGRPLRRVPAVRAVSR